MKTQRGSRSAAAIGLTLAIWLSTPGLATGQAVEARPRVIAADEGAVGSGENGFTSWFKVGSISTGASQLYMGTGIVPPGAETPPHLHEIDEEVLYVLEGEITLTLNGTVHTVGKGGTAFIPPGTWMQVSNRSGAPAHVMGILPRGEVERCFRALYMTDDYDESERQDDIATCRTRLGEGNHSPGSEAVHDR